jgi:hypothetical protein
MSGANSIPASDRNRRTANPGCHETIVWNAEIAVNGYIAHVQTDYSIRPAVGTRRRWVVSPSAMVSKWRYH